MTCVLVNMLNNGLFQTDMRCVTPSRKLSRDELHRLQIDHVKISNFKQKKLESEAEKNWDLFYKRNTTKFFKDRHWTKREFQELVNDKMVNFLLKYFVLVCIEYCFVSFFIFKLISQYSNN